MRLIDADKAAKEIANAEPSEGRIKSGAFITSCVMMTAFRSSQRMVVARYLMRWKGHSILTSKHSNERK